MEQKDRFGPLLLGWALVPVVSLGWTQLSHILGLNPDAPVSMIANILIAVGWFLFPILMAVRIQSMPIRICVIALCSVFMVNSILNVLDLFSLYRPWFDTTGFVHFQF